MKKYFTPSANKWPRLLAIALLAGFSWIALNVLTRPIPGLVQYNVLKVMLGVFILVGLIVLLLVFFQRTTPKLRRNRWIYPWAIGIFFIVTLAAHLFIGRAMLSTGYKWDVETVFYKAVEVVNFPESTKSAQRYFSNYPNNLPILAVLVGLFKLTNFLSQTDYLLRAVVFNIVILTLCQLLTFLCCKELFGRRVAVVSLLFSTPLITFSLYSHIPYTDTFAMLFPVLCFYLYLRAKRAPTMHRQLILVALLGIATVAGFYMKQTAAIMTIAIIMIEAARLLSGASPLRQRARLKRAGMASLILLLSTFLTAIIVPAGIERMQLVEVIPEARFPVSSWIDTGIHTYPTPMMYGGYDEKVVSKFRKLPTVSARDEAARKSIAEQLRAYGPFGYAKFLHNKAVWIFSDGTFFAYGEAWHSHRAIRFIRDDPSSTLVQSFMFIKGNQYRKTATLLQIVWATLMLCIALQAFIVYRVWRKTTQLPLLMLYLAIFGLLLFLLIFQARSRYLYLYVPIFIITGMYTVAYLQNQLVKTAKK